ncbi:hypothetical protein FEM48_Zijuj06G0209700 [Ziziphus jujuba var. spinosa]|uniref:Late embryogenesis abundant protein LEA-2 subgroup domain-containing protein n=1 Tax=Ziziphus jujuba var. spinosa TaxID=714518 RepID=A0A978VBK9_ZIZJJ|nr:hypothetical protein FEM48_Zijuj06G0209700 [Ziziphus jujuba var. spinosa]
MDPLQESSSDSHQIVIGYPIAALNQNQPREEGRSFKATPVRAEADNQPREEGRSFEATKDRISKCECYCLLCLLLGLVLLPVIFFLALSPFLRLYFPDLPSVSLESISFTVANIVSDTQVASNLEAVFRMKNNYVHNNITHYHVNALAFHIKSFPNGNFGVIEEKQLVANATVAPFKQYGKEDKRFRARMNGVVVDVDEYEQHIHGRYGVSYLKFGLMGFLSVEGGGKQLVKPVKPTSSIRATCHTGFRLVFPWNQTITRGVQPPITCDVHGDWRTLSDGYDKARPYSGEILGNAAFHMCPEDVDTKDLQKQH